MSYDTTDQVLNDLYQQYELKHSRYLRFFRTWKWSACLSPIGLVPAVVFLWGQPLHLLLWVLVGAVIVVNSLLYQRMAKAESYLADLGGQITDYQDELRGLKPSRP